MNSSPNWNASSKLSNLPALSRVKTELARRAKVRCQTLIGFTEYRYARYRTSAHHRLVAEQLERVQMTSPDRELLRQAQGI
jgi:hypothetical protein